MSCFASFASLRRVFFLNRQRIRLRGIEPVLLYRLGHAAAIERALVGQRRQARDHDPVAVDFEEVAQFAARIGTAETVGAEHRITADTYGRICSANART